MLPLRYKEEYFFEYQNIVLEIQWTVLILSMDMSVGRYSEIRVKYEHLSSIIFGDERDESNCMDMAVTRPKT
jgi:hypothetical protein